jgi:hypothetical protein
MHRERDEEVQVFIEYLKCNEHMLLTQIIRNIKEKDTKK